MSTKKTTPAKKSSKTTSKKSGAKKLKQRQLRYQKNVSV